MHPDVKKLLTLIKRVAGYLQALIEKLERGEEI